MRVSRLRLSSSALGLRLPERAEPAQVARPHRAVALLQPARGPVRRAVRIPAAAWSAERLGPRQHRQPGPRRDVFRAGGDRDAARRDADHDARCPGRPGPRCRIAAAPLDRDADHVLASTDRAPTTRRPSDSATAIGRAPRIWSEASALGSTVSSASDDWLPLVARIRAVPGACARATPGERVDRGDLRVARGPGDLRAAQRVALRDRARRPEAGRVAGAHRRHARAVDGDRRQPPARARPAAAR